MLFQALKEAARIAVGPWSWKVSVVRRPWNDGTHVASWLLGASEPGSRALRREQKRIR